MAFQDVTCVEDDITGLAVCQVDLAAVGRLHSTLRRITAYLEEHALTSVYHYRDRYLLAAVSGNDVTACNRVIAEAKARGIAVPSVLQPLDSFAYTPVLSDDVAYTAQLAVEITDALEALFQQIQAYDYANRRKIPSWLLLLGVITFSVTLSVIVTEQARS